MTKTVAKKTVSTKKGAAKPAQAPTARNASGAKPAGKKSKKPSPQTMDALDFFVYTYSRF